MQKIDTAKIANGVKELIEKRSTLKQMKGVTNDELEAVYSLAFGLLATAGLFFGSGLIGGSVLSDPRTVGSLRVLSASLLPAALSSALSGYFIGVKRVGFNAAVSVFCQLVRILLTVILAPTAACKI